MYAGRSPYAGRTPYAGRDAATTPVDVGPQPVPWAASRLPGGAASPAAARRIPNGEAAAAAVRRAVR
jgi:hypothetical protein